MVQAQESERDSMDLTTKNGRREQGLRIQRAVERANLSIEELANRIGCSRALIYQYLAGTTLAQPDRLQNIARECGVTLTYFYTEEETPLASAPAQTPTAGITPQDITPRLTENLRLLTEIAEAQESPPDYRSLAATCERILSLAGQLGDHATQARAQKRLGNARLRMADFPKAVEALQKAIQYAQETDDKVSEAGARQSLGNALLAMGRISEAREQFTQIAGGTVFDGRWQGTLSLGCIHEMQGEYAKAMARFDEAAGMLEEAEANGTSSPNAVASAMLYVNTNRRNVYMDGGDFAGARPLAEKCLAAAEAIGNADQHLEARFDLGWCDFATGRWASAYRDWTMTLQLARFLGDQGRETMARAWLGILLAALGDYDTAIAYGKDALALALSHGDRRAELYAQLALADAYIATTNRDSEARYHTNQALAVTVALRYERGEIECRLRLARLSAQTDDLMELRDAASRSLVLAQRLGATHLESLAHHWLAHAWLREGEITQAEQEATHALQIAQAQNQTEAIWRASDLLAEIALRKQNPIEAEALLRGAIHEIEALRGQLRQADIPDSLLENTDTLAVYARLASLLREQKGEDSVNELLEQTGWFPLTTRFTTE
jgi:tetratricopeptide (TPR) repeat protein